MTDPSAGIDPGTVTALIGIVVVVSQILGRVIDKLFALVNKNRQGNPSSKLNGTLEKVADRMVDMIITQKDLSANQLQIAKSLDALSGRFEKDLNGLGVRMDRRLDQFEKHLSS
jgi:hypothetical protein